MNKEMKFKAWDNFNSKMIEIGSFEEICVNKDLDFANYNVLFPTGLRADDEREIYEGYILDIEFGESGLSSSFVHKGVEVYWNEEFLQFCVRGGNLTTRMVTSLAGYVKPTYKVIGNIYENKELLTNNN